MTDAELIAFFRQEYNHKCEDFDEALAQGCSVCLGLELCNRLEIENRRAPDLRALPVLEKLLAWDLANEGESFLDTGESIALEMLVKALRDGG